MKRCIRAGVLGIVVGGIVVGAGLFAAGCASRAGSTTKSASRIELAESGRTVAPFDQDWRFNLGDVKDGQAASLDTAAWRTLDVPHDWSIEGKFDRSNPTTGAGAWLPSGVAWYRKSFVLPRTASGKRVAIEFDGVMHRSDVWVNGVHLGKRPNGYVSFTYDLTPHLKFGDGNTNVIAVRADTSKQPASRWYSGAGIYRHVRLVLKDPIHLQTWGTYVATPHIQPEQATVEVQCEALNGSKAPADLSLRVEIIAPDGTAVSSTDSSPTRVEAGKRSPLTHSLWIKQPKMWDIGAGNVYTARVQLRAGDKILDEEPVKFGVREFLFEPDAGFILNRKNVKIKGVCLHHDASAFGAAVPIGVWERRLNNLRELGVNGIRTAHNPPDPAFLDLCDRMGFVVMDEMFDAWRVGKNPHDYHLEFDEWSQQDTRDTVRRDRNHPSVVLYSAGNEIHDTPKGEPAKAILSGLVKVFHENDPYRPVTQGLFRPNVSRDYHNGLADILDVVGQNYRENELIAAADQKPTRKIIGTENGHGRSQWLALRDDPRMAGQFLWVGIDYLGESRTWPGIGSGSGLLDRTGMPKAMAFERKSWWADAPTVFATRRTAPTPPQAVDPGYENSPASATTAATSPTTAAATTATGATEVVPPEAPPIAPDIAAVPTTAPTTPSPTTSAATSPATRSTTRGRRAAAGPYAAGATRRGGQVLFPDWTPRITTPHNENVEVYSNCPTVELTLNGKSLGAKPRNDDDSSRVWQVPYEPGTLSAVGSDAGKVLATHSLRTAGKPAAIRLTADRKTLATGWDEVAHAEVTVVDENGTLVPSAADLVKFEVGGAGVLAAVDSADNRSHESFRGNERKAYQGRCLAVLKASEKEGTVTLTASAAGLKSDTISIKIADSK